MYSTDDTIADCQSITEVLDGHYFDIIIQDISDSDYIYCSKEEFKATPDKKKKKKKEEEDRHAIFKIDVVEFTLELVGYFFGELMALTIVPDDSNSMLYGFVYDPEH